MLRVLVELGPLKIYSYGFALTLAFGVGIILAMRRARLRGIQPEDIMDLSTHIIFAAIVGSRALYVLFHRDGYWPRWWDVFKVWEGGLTVYGGALAAVLVSYWFCRRRGVSFFRVADTLAPSLALGVGITRIGCFLNGCCFGKPCDLPWAVRFPEGSLADFVLGQASLHPSQLYASAAGFGVFVVLLWIDRKPRMDGFLFWLFVLFFAGATFFTDFSRYWEQGATVLHAGQVALSANQLLELGLMVLAVLMLAREGGRMERADGPT